MEPTFERKEDNRERATGPDGPWWEYRIRLTHGVARAMTEANLKAINPSRFQDEDGMGRNMVAKAGVEIDWSRWDLGAEEDILLLGMTVAWSYGETVDKEVLDLEVPEDHYQAIVKRLNALQIETGSPLPVNGSSS